MKFPLSRELALTSAIAVQAAFVQGAGYGINEQSASYLGTAFAGRASNVTDAAISSANPGGIGLAGRQISAGADLIMKGGEFRGKYEGPFGTVEGSAKNHQQQVLVPSGYFTIPVNDKWSIGISGYAPYGIELQYDDNWPGAYFSDMTSVRVINLQGAVSYKLTDDLSIGAGLIGSYAKGKLTQKTWIQPALIEADVRVEGDDYTYGWNLGAVWNASKSTTLGFAYHSELDFTIKGDFSLKNISFELPNQTLPTSLKITMPERVLVSMTHHVNNRWTAMTDLTWTRWSRFKEFNITTPQPKIGAYVPMNWSNTWALSLGSSYQLNERWLLRAGYMFDESPVNNHNRTVRSPDSNRNWVTLGANWKATEVLTMDFAYAYIRLQKGKIYEGKNDTSGKPNPDYGYISGEYDSDSHVIGLQLNYAF